MKDKAYISWLEERVVRLESDLAQARKDHRDSLERLSYKFNQIFKNA